MPRTFDKSFLDLIYEKEQNYGKNLIIGIDGPCGSGKTTLAHNINEKYGYNIVHMDDFYLPFEKRDKNWTNIIAGHMDFDRLIDTVLKPYKEKGQVNYISYDCHSDKYLEKINIDLDRPLVIEGSYTFHPAIKEYIDFKIFVDVDEKTQIDRLTKRNKDVVDKFISMWIPFENKYFETLDIKKLSDIVVSV